MNENQNLFGDIRDRERDRDRFLDDAYLSDFERERDFRRLLWPNVGDRDSDFMKITSSSLLGARL